MWIYSMVVAGSVCVLYGCESNANHTIAALDRPRNRSNLGNENVANSHSSSSIPRQNVVPIPPSNYSCTSSSVGLYSWGYEVWNSVQSPLVDFLLNPSVREYSCGDVYVNVADYSSTHYIENENLLVPFIRNVRATGNSGIVYLVYGDVQVSANGSPDGPSDFANVFFDWLDRVSKPDLDIILPLGLSFDCEHMPVKTVEDALTTAQNRKKTFLSKWKMQPNSQVTIQWTIEGQKKPQDTDVIMKLADSALMMAYRNNFYATPTDPEGKDTIVSRIFDFMLSEQCEHCLHDNYAKKYYKAKISIMVEADCVCGKSCRKISFCGAKENSVEYLKNTLRLTYNEVKRRLTSEQFQRLFATDENSMFVIHNWQWFTCFFRDNAIAARTPWGSAKSHTCDKFESMSKSCQSQ